MMKFTDRGYYKTHRPEPFYCAGVPNTLLSRCKIHAFNASVTLVLLIATELFTPLLSSEPSAKKVRQTDLRVLAADGAFSFEV